MKNVRICFIEMGGNGADTKSKDFLSRMSGADEKSKHLVFRDSSVDEKYEHFFLK
jgi:hypothetical protein